MKSIRNKLIVLMLLSTVLPTVISIIITYYYTSDSLKHRAIQENSQLIYQGKVNIQNYMKEINRMSLAFYNSSVIFNILEKGLSDYDSELNINVGLQNMKRIVSEVQQIYFYLNKNKHSYLYNDDSFLRGPIGEDFNIQDTNVITKIEPPHQRKDYNIVQAAPFVQPTVVFTYYRRLLNIPNNQPLGSLSIDIKLDKLRQICQQMYTQEGREGRSLFLLDNEQQVLYSSDESLLGNKLDEPWIHQIKIQRQLQGSLEWKDNSFWGLIIYETIQDDNINWTLIKRVSYNELFQQARKVVFINMLVTSLCLVTSIGATILVSFRFTEPIKKLIRNINKVQLGKLDEPIDVSREDEIGVLAEHFRSMMNSINDYILREYKLNLINKTNELKMLQSQINPHFLNNALQSIGTLALKSEGMKVYSLLSSLAQMMQSNMNTSELIVPLSKELEYVKDYLHLQEIRFKLKYSFEIDPNTTHIAVPKMFIQPVVENFFKHGFNSRKDGFLRVSSEQKDAYLIIIVEDNGSGIPEERLQLIQSKLETGNQATTPIEASIGLTNVMSRLRLYYGEQARISLVNRTPHGLQVTLTIPLEDGGIKI